MPCLARLSCHLISSPLKTSKWRIKRPFSPLDFCEELRPSCRDKSLLATSFLPGPNAGRYMNTKSLTEKELSEISHLSFCFFCLGRTETTMGWTDLTRRQYARRARRYASDLTDREWGLISPCLPGPRRFGRPRSTGLREVVNALLYIARQVVSGECCQRTFHRLRQCRPISTNGGQRVVGSDQPSSCDGGERGGRAASLTVCGRDRQPERENHRKRRNCGL